MFSLHGTIKLKSGEDHAEGICKILGSLKLGLRVRCCWFLRFHLWLLLRASLVISRLDRQELMLVSLDTEGIQLGILLSRHV